MTHEELKALRIRHSLTQAAFGALLGGYTANYISRLERDDEKISQRFEKLVHLIFPQKKVRKGVNTP